MRVSTLTHLACGHTWDVPIAVAERVRVDPNGGRARTVRDYRRDEKGQPVPMFDKDGARATENDGSPAFEHDEREVFDNPVTKCPGCGVMCAHPDLESLIVNDEGRVFVVLSSNREREIVEMVKAGVLKVR